MFFMLEDRGLYGLIKIFKLIGCRLAGPECISFFVVFVVILEDIYIFGYYILDAA
jgi:hypothetical protein